MPDQPMDPPADPFGAVTKLVDDVHVFDAQLEPEARGAAGLKLLTDAIIVTRDPVNVIAPGLLPFVDALLQAIRTLGPIVFVPDAAPGPVQPPHADEMSTG